MAKKKVRKAARPRKRVCTKFKLVKVVGSKKKQRRCKNFSSEMSGQKATCTRYAIFVDDKGNKYKRCMSFTKTPANVKHGKASEKARKSVGIKSKYAYKKSGPHAAGRISRKGTKSKPVKAY